MNTDTPKHQRIRGAPMPVKKYKTKMDMSLVDGYIPPEFICKTNIKVGSGNYKNKYRCFCGNEFVTLKASVKSGHTKSCGCLYDISKQICNKGRTPGNAYKDPTESSFNRLYLDYFYSSSERGHELALSKDELRTLTKQDCHYCGAHPSSKVKTVTGREPYIYNGIDRKDNSKGYYLDNCLPCCSRCNFAKGGMGYDEFISYCKIISERFKE